ncbi:unnamed protein product [marine sediment metagenome]|uniref:Uncharacterized protein n=1 Tax=marine sediment metagenome TaxID=412755 RepID=X0ZLU9_9ZZZZ
MEYFDDWIACQETEDWKVEYDCVRGFKTMQEADKYSSETQQGNRNTFLTRTNRLYPNWIVERSIRWNYRDADIVNMLFKEFL